MSVRRKDRGGALLVALVIVVIVVGIGGSFLIESIFRSRSALLQTEMDDAQRLIDAALEQSRRLLFVYKDTGTWNWSDILVYNQGFTIDPFALKPLALAELRKKQAGDPTTTLEATTWPEMTPPPNRTTPNADPSPFGRFFFYGKGVWYVVVRNNPEEADPRVDTDGQLILYITATMPDGVQRSIEASVRYSGVTMTTLGAVMTGGTIKIWGNGGVNISPTGVATEANVMTNANGIVQGSVTINGKVQALGTVSTNGNPVITQGTAEHQVKFVLPMDPPSAYLNLATVILRRDGSVTSGGVPQPPNKFGGFSFSKGKWSLTGNPPTAPSGVYYIEGDLDVSGHPQIQATLLVEGSVDMSGKPTTTAQADLTADFKNVAIYAGGDVRISGTVTINGIIIAHEQVKLSGNVTVKGSVIAVDAEDRYSLVSPSSGVNDEIAGDVTVMFPGPKDTFLKIPKETLDLMWVRARP